MNKKYLIENAKDYGGMSLEVFKEDAKEVEVLDADEVYTDFIESEEYRLLDYLKANKYLIVKIIE